MNLYCCLEEEDSTEVERARPSDLSQNEGQTSDKLEDQPEPHGALLGLPNFNALCISKHIHPSYYYIDLYSYSINSKITYSPRNCF